MNRVKGKAVYKGGALGRIYILQGQEYEIKEEQTQNVEEELGRLNLAKEKAIEELQMLYNKVLKAFGKDDAEIVQVQISMLEDEDYWESMEDKVTSQHRNAEYAVWETGAEYAEVYSVIDNDFMKERKLDIQHITRLMIRHLCGFTNADSIKEPVIIVSDDFLLTDMILLDESKILAFVAVHGSTNPYIALLAKMMKVPALAEVDMDLSTLVSGMEAAVDGFTGEFVQEPDEDTRNAILSHMEE